ncbi:dihydrofolate reductase [Bacteroidales bacterium OttesenSCG-928-C19]|nr:dihydrofolate reductase [Bacteroidales bacterium OttesenSCG-928-C19]
MKNLSIIVAIAENYAIGKNNDLLWHISDDLKRFKQITAGHTVIMGRNTWESLPFKPLPKRKNIVLTSNKSLQYEGAVMVHSYEEVFNELTPNEENFIMGGGKVYKDLFPYADKLYITWVYKPFDADTFFPEIDENEWKIVEKSETFHDEKSGLEYAYFTYERI